MMNSPIKPLTFFSLLLLFATQLIAEEAKPNVLLICVDDLRPELNCYGVDYIHSPEIDRLAAEGIRFDRHYVQAPTCGASRYTLLTGTYGPASNAGLFNRADKLQDDATAATPSLPAWLREHGYTTVAIGKVSHHPGGLGGKNWDDPDELEMPFSWDRNLMPSGAWQHPRGAMHGLANGEIRKDASDMDVFQSYDGPDTAYPDGLITEKALEELQELADAKKPFFLAVGLIRPHLPFGAPAQYMQPYADITLPEIPHSAEPQGRTTWHKSAEFMKYNRWGKDPNTDEAFAEAVRKHYAASVSYSDAQVGKILDDLDSLGLAENTVVILWGDHGWHLGEHAIWGKHSLFEESLRAPLIIRYPSKFPAGASSAVVVETVDIFPTITDLLQMPTPDFLDGESLASQANLNGTESAAVSYHGGAVTLRSDNYRLIVHNDGYVELYDHDSAEKETLNIANKRPDVVRELAAQLHRMAPEKLPTVVVDKIILK